MATGSEETNAASSAASPKAASSHLDSDATDFGTCCSHRAVSVRSPKLGASCTVHEWYPTQFRRLREACGITDQEFVASLCAQPLQGGQQGAGKSAAVFFRSQDHRYVLKSMKNSERDFFQKRFHGPYFQHMLGHLNLEGTKCGPQTLLCRFLAMVEIELVLEAEGLGKGASLKRKW